MRQTFAELRLVQTMKQLAKFTAEEKEKLQMAKERD